MENIELFRRANTFSKPEIAAFKKILMDAGQVKEEAFEGLIEKNPKILFIGNTENPTGIGALKVPHKSYKDGVFKKAYSDKNPNDYDFELGWVVNLSIGNGNKIVAALAGTKDKKVYATVREDNIPIITLLKKYGFEQNGEPYLSGRGDYKVLLFIKAIDGH